MNVKKIIVLLVLAGSVASANLLQWGSGEQIKNENDTLLTTTFSGTGSLGAFAQLVYAGANGTIDAFANSGTGVSGDDVVVDISFAYGINGPDVPLFLRAELTGVFALTNSDVDSAAENGNYYVRIYNGVNENYGDGVSAAVAGVSTISHYWNSSVATFAWSDIAANQQFDFTASGAPAVGDWQAVPEPATMGLLAIGGGISLLVNRRKRNA